MNISSHGETVRNETGNLRVTAEIFSCWTFEPNPQSIMKKSCEERRKCFLQD
jgi:hypothetical protein